MNEVMLEEAYKQAELDILFQKIYETTINFQFIDIDKFNKEVKDVIYELYEECELKPYIPKKKWGEGEEWKGSKATSAKGA